MLAQELWDHFGGSLLRGNSSEGGAAEGGQSKLQLTREARLWAGKGAGRVPGCPRSPGQGIAQQWLQFSGRLGRGCRILGPRVSH